MKIEYGHVNSLLPKEEILKTHKFKELHYHCMVFLVKYHKAKQIEEFYKGLKDDFIKVDSISFKEFRKYLIDKEVGRIFNLWMKEAEEYLWERILYQYSKETLKAYLEIQYSNPEFISIMTTKHIRNTLLEHFRRIPDWED